MSILGCLVVSIPLTPTFGTGRFLAGYSSGLFTAICPLFISEIAPKEILG